MPLYALPDMKLVTRVPHQKENKYAIDKIDTNAKSLVVAEINRLIDDVVDTDAELITSGWLPGHDWTDTVWAPIYEAAGNNYKRAGMVFGVIVFEVMMNRAEDWSFGKYPKDGREIGSMTYFRIYR